MNPLYEIRVLRTLVELEEIRAAWQSWPGNDDSDMDMYRAYLASSQEVESPHVVAVFREGQPDVIWVGRKESVQLDLKVGYVHLRPKARLLYFVYGGPRGNTSKENCELLVRHVYDSLSKGEADCAYLNYLQTGSEMDSLASSIPNVFCRDRTPAEQTHFSARLGDTAEEFYKTLSPKVRKNQRWQAKKFVQAFPEGVTIRCFRAENEIESLVHDVERIAKRSYQRGLGVGFVDSPGMRQHLRAKARKGGLRGHVLYAGERPCAFWIGSLNLRTFGSEFLGFDPEFATYSPGMYLILRVIEEFYSGSEGLVTEVDFATGSAQYKEVLGNQQWNESSKYIFAPSARGIELSLLRLATGFMDKSAKLLLQRMGVLGSVKRSWRQRAQKQAEVTASAEGVPTLMRN